MNNSMGKNMIKKIVAFPGSNAGLKGELVGHFGHTPIFTVVEYDTEKEEIVQVTSVSNPPHESGGCMKPVMLLKNAGVTDVVLGGIGFRPLMGFKQVGINTYRGEPGTVQFNFEKFLKNELSKLETASCGQDHSDDGCNH